MNNIENGKNPYKNFVTWKVFVWAIALILTLTGYTFAVVRAMGDRMDECNQSYTKIEVQLSGIQTDLVWIKQAMR